MAYLGRALALATAVVAFLIYCWSWHSPHSIGACHEVLVGSAQQTLCQPIGFQWLVPFVIPIAIFLLVYFEIVEMGLPGGLLRMAKRKQEIDDIESKRTTPDDLSSRVAEKQDEFLPSSDASH